jgi:hypothetical protein
LFKKLVGVLGSEDNLVHTICTQETGGEAWRAMKQLWAGIDNVHIFGVCFAVLSQIVGGTQAYDAAAQYDGVGVVGDSVLADGHG